MVDGGVTGEGDGGGLVVVVEVEVVVESGGIKSLRVVGRRW